jgi:hypothetical protein
MKPLLSIVAGCLVAGCSFAAAAGCCLILLRCEVYKKAAHHLVSKFKTHASNFIVQ